MFQELFVFDFKQKTKKRKILKNVSTEVVQSTIIKGIKSEANFWDVGIVRDGKIRDEKARNSQGWNSKLRGGISMKLLLVKSNKLVDLKFLDFCWENNLFGYKNRNFPKTKMLKNPLRNALSCYFRFLPHLCYYSSQCFQLLLPPVLILTLILPSTGAGITGSGYYVPDNSGISNFLQLWITTKKKIFITALWMKLSPAIKREIKKRELRKCFNCLLLFKTKGGFVFLEYLMLRWNVNE